jgi:hypothetical protein
VNREYTEPHIIPSEDVRVIEEVLSSIVKNYQGKGQEDLNRVMEQYSPILPALQQNGEGEIENWSLSFNIANFKTRGFYYVEDENGRWEAFETLESIPQERRDRASQEKIVTQIVITNMFSGSMFKYGYLEEIREKLRERGLTNYHVQHGGSPDGLTIEITKLTPEGPITKETAMIDSLKYLKENKSINPENVGYFGDEFVGDVVLKEHFVILDLDQNALFEELIEKGYLSRIDDNKAEITDNFRKLTSYKDLQLDINCTEEQKKAIFSILAQLAQGYNDYVLYTSTHPDVSKVNLFAVNYIYSELLKAPDKLIQETVSKKPDSRIFYAPLEFPTENQGPKATRQIWDKIIKEETPTPAYSCVGSRKRSI